jgi:ubiquinone/menaquinone biosynthesis C-methylase UbiE
MRSRATPRDPGRWLYELLAPVYDRASGEGVLYAVPRARAIELLNLAPGARVLDIACGTGRNHQAILERIGADGRLVGVDRSPRMLSRARDRVARHDWRNVQLVQSDATHLTPVGLQALGVTPPGGGFDAVLCTLGLTVVSDWRAAWRSMLGLVRVGGRIAIMDAGYPARPGCAGETVALRPVTWLLCRLFAADPLRQPWRLVAPDTEETTEELFTLGYIGVAAGTTVSPSRAEAARERSVR